jgi:glucosamine kinase
LIYLGIDGGGSKTRFLLVDNQDQELALAEAGPSNWGSVGPVVAKESLTNAIRRLPTKPDIVCGGFAGAARAEAAWFYRHTLEELLPKATVFVETDALVAYVGAIGFEPGVLLIAGTGSIAIGRKAGGEMIRVGGWGPFFGDEGAGFWIGREAVRTALRAQDADEFPEFTRSVREALGLGTITEVVAAWTTGKIGVPAVAAIAVEVARQYPAQPAVRILNDAAAHLRSLVETASKRIDLPGCKKSISGSVGTNPLIQQLIGIPFSSPMHSPERGAILWARSQR